METQDKSGLERFLGLFAEVKSGEGATALLMALNVFILLTSYYIVKPVREALILAGGGAEIKSYAAAGQGLLLLGAVPLYALLANKFTRRKLINTVTLFFVGCLVLFYLLAQIEVPLGVVFFLWVGIFNLMVISQFWSFANDIYSEEQGKRLFPIIAFGASSGAVGGSYITGVLTDPLGVYQLMLVAGALLLFSLVLTGIADRRARERVVEPGATQPQEEEPMGEGGAFKLVIGNRYLLLIALLLLLLNWVNTTGEYILSRTVANAASEAFAAQQGEVVSGAESAAAQKAFAQNYISKFYSDFFAVVNLVGLLIQLFVVSRVIKYVGIRVALLILPCIAFVGYAFLAFFPLLAVVRWAKTAENATDYSLQNTVRQALFLPTTREEKYKAKQAIDTFFVRAGDVMSAVLVYVGVNLLAFETGHFAMVNMGLVAIWLLLAVAIGRGYNRLSSGQAAAAE